MAIKPEYYYMVLLVVGNFSSAQRLSTKEDFILAEPQFVQIKSTIKYQLCHVIYLPG